jgi:hypothetical protein
MSTHENAMLDELACTVASQRTLLRWILGGIAMLVASVITATAWVVRQEGDITSLREADKASFSDRAVLHQNILSLREAQHRAQIESTRFSSDIGFIRETVTEIKQQLSRKSTASNP